MRRTWISLAVCFGTLLATSSASAQGAKKPTEKAAPVAAPAAGAPSMSIKPPAEMDKIKWMVGTWQCTGKTLATALGPEHPSEAEVTSEMMLDGMWIAHHYREKKTAQNPMPISSDEVWTYVAAAKTWTRLVIDNTGGWASGSGKGWEKGKMVWTSDGMLAGQKTKFRDTFTEKGPREIHYVGEIGSAEGKLSTLWDINCKKK